MVRTALVLLALLAACALLPILVAQLISRLAPVGGVELAILYVIIVTLAAFVWHRLQRRWSKA